MYNFLSDQFAESVHDLVHDLESLFLLELFSFYEFFQVSIFAVFCDYVQTVFGTEYVLELYDVSMVKSFE